MRIFFSLLAALLLVAGCSPEKYTMQDALPKNIDSRDADLVTAGYALADALNENALLAVPPESRIIVVSFADINDLTRSSTLGRMLAEHVASRLVQQGHSVIDLKVRQDSLFIKEGAGEFALSRDVQVLGKTHGAAVLVVGTYGKTRRGVSLSARMIRAADNMILSAADYTLRP